MIANKEIPERINLEDLQKPNIAKKEKRTEKISVFLTPTEKKEIIRLSKKYSLKMSSYLRFKGISDFAIAKGRGIERIKQEQLEDPLRAEMRKGFSEVIKEIKQGFKENRKFLKPIPIEVREEIMERKQAIKKQINL